VPYTPAARRDPFPHRDPPFPFFSHPGMSLERTLICPPSFYKVGCRPYRPPFCTGPITVPPRRLSSHSLRPTSLGPFCQSPPLPLFWIIMSCLFSSFPRTPRASRPPSGATPFVVSLGPDLAFLGEKGSNNEGVSVAHISAASSSAVLESRRV